MRLRLSGQCLRRRDIALARLVAFHTLRTFQVLTHSQAAFRRLGRLVTEAGCRQIETLAEGCTTELMGTLRRELTCRAHANVLHYLPNPESERGRRVQTGGEVVRLIQAIVFSLFSN